MIRTRGPLCFFISDLSSNHNQDLDRCLRLINTAKEIGCWGVKIQLFKADKLYAPGYIPKGLKEREIPEDWIPLLAKHCKEIDIKFGGTPFHLEAVDVLAPHVDFLKISSFDLLRLDLIRKCMKTKRPLILSTGSAMEYEIVKVMSIIHEIIITTPIINSSFLANNDLFFPYINFLHCVSDYPTRKEDCKLRKLNTLKKLLKNWYYPGIGWSDHTSDVDVIYEAYCRGAQVIEFHLDLEDGKGAEFQYEHCYTPSQIKPVIQKIDREITENRYLIMDLEETRIKKARELRADPSDGLRPMKSARDQ